MSNPNLSRARENYAKVKAAVETAGRDPHGVKIANLTFPVGRANHAEAEDKRAVYDQLPNLIDDLSLLSEGLNFDFSGKGTRRTTVIRRCSRHDGNPRNPKSGHRGHGKRHTHT